MSWSLPFEGEAGAPDVSSQWSSRKKTSGSCLSKGRTWAMRSCLSSDQITSIGTAFIFISDHRALILCAAGKGAPHFANSLRDISSECFQCCLPLLFDVELAQVITSYCLMNEKAITFE